MKRMLEFVLVALLCESTLAASSTEFSKRVRAGSSDHISVSNVAGAVRVLAWDRPEVEVQGQLGEGVDRVEVQQRGASVDIRVVARQPRRDSYANLDIRVPAGSELEVSTVSASIAVDGVRGRSRLKSVSGSIRSNGQGGDLEAKSVSGSIEMNGSGQPGRLRASTVSGGVRLGRVTGEVEASSTSGSLRIDAETVDRVQLKSVSGSVSFKGRLLKSGDLEAETVSGSINVIVAADVGYDYDISTFSGAIRSCFDEEELSSRSRSPGSRLSGQRGKGDGNLRIRAMSGSVTLCDR
jgi:DUF4097 and DUF4098 domain-containing protein YvlB